MSDRPLPAAIPPPRFPDRPPADRRRPDLPLPTRRYLPGEGRHPRFERGAAGRAAAPAFPAWDPARPWREDAGWLHGLDLLDAGFPWEAHEVLEGWWRTVPRDRPEARAAQLLVLVAALLIKARLGHARAAAVLRAKVRDRGAALVAEAGPVFLGVDWPATLAGVERALATGGWPRVVGGWPGRRGTAGGRGPTGSASTA